MATDALRRVGDAGARTATEVACAHCGLPVPAGLVDARARAGSSAAPAAAPRSRSCTSTASIAYYDFAERRDAPVRASGTQLTRSSTTRRSTSCYVRRRADGPGARPSSTSRACTARRACGWSSACRWWCPGVARAELDVRALAGARRVGPRARCRCRPIARFARHASATRRIRSAASRARPCAAREDRAMLVRIGVAGAIAINVMLAGARALQRLVRPAWSRSSSATSAGSACCSPRPRCSGPGRVFFRGALGVAAHARAAHGPADRARARRRASRAARSTPSPTAGPIYFDGVAMLIFLLLVGRFLQQRGQRAAADAAELLHALAPHGAHRRGGRHARGARRGAAARHGARGARRRDASPPTASSSRGAPTSIAALLTGESRPVPVAAGDAVFAGTLNSHGAAARARRAGRRDEPRRAAPARGRGRARGAARPVVQLADRLAGMFVAVVLALAALTWAVVAAARPGARARQRDRAAHRHLPVRARAGHAARHHRGDRARGAGAAS